MAANLQMESQALEATPVLEELRRARAAAAHAPRSRPIGAILLDAGLVRLDDVERIVVHAREKRLRFGDAAVALGLVKEGDLNGALAYQFDYPVLAPGSSPISREVVAAYEATLPVLDDLRALRNQILLRWLTAEGERNRVVAVLSPDRGEGRSFIAANLAVTFSQMGQRTLLIDADLRRPRIHQLFGLDNQAGLSAMLAERQVPNTLHRIEALRDLSVITCGGTPPNPNDLISRSALGELLEGFSRAHDVIVVDTPAAAEFPEAEMIAARARGVVVVARKAHSRFKAVRDLAHSVQALGATVIGSVLADS